MDDAQRGIEPAQPRLAESGLNRVQFQFGFHPKSNEPNQTNQFGTRMNADVRG
jgi:hypothetical protein